MAATPIVKTPISDLPKSVRRRVQKLIEERAVLAYSFSWERLKELLGEGTLDELKDCVVAHKDKELKPITDAINKELAEIFQEHDVRVLECADPWGRSKQFVYLESTTSSLNRQNFTAIMMREYGLSAEAVQSTFERATVKTPYITVQCRDAEDEWKGEKK